jgi:hypothetical protein
MNKQIQMVNDVIETRRWAVKTESTKSGGDYRKLKTLYPNENDYKLVRRLYWHLAFKGRGTWDSYFNSNAPKEHNHQFDNYLLPGVWAPAKGMKEKRGDRPPPLAKLHNHLPQNQEKHGN